MTGERETSEKHACVEGDDGHGGKVSSIFNIQKSTY